MAIPSVAPSEAFATCPTVGEQCDPKCFKIHCKDGRRMKHKCLKKGFEWFEARDYLNPGNVAGCMIHKTATGVGGCYKTTCASETTPGTCEAKAHQFWCRGAPTTLPSAAPSNLGCDDAEFLEKLQQCGYSSAP